MTPRERAIVANFVVSLGLMFALAFLIPVIAK